MKFTYISENKIYLYDNGKTTELTSKRAEHYINTVRSINQSKEWKHSGTGAQFTGAVEHHNDDDSVPFSITGLAASESGLIYSINLGGMGGLYNMLIDNPDADEEHILTQANTTINSISLKEDKIAACIRSGDGCHISVVSLKGNVTEITDGDSFEKDPKWSKTDGKLFCATAGYARDSYQRIAAVSPLSIIAIDTKNNTVDELFSDEKTDFFKPSNDSNGNFYYIKQPYKVPKENSTPIWKDILLFPVRIVKAIIGFLNAFSVIFGGESLRGENKRSDVKSKQKTNKELFFEGRLLEAEKNEKENAAKGDKNAGIFPPSRELAVVLNDGTEKIIKKGILDYTVLDDGRILCSNGKQISIIENGEETVIVKAKFAQCITVIS